MYKARREPELCDTVVKVSDAEAPQLTLHDLAFAALNPFVQDFGRTTFSASLAGDEGGGGVRPVRVKVHDPRRIPEWGTAFWRKFGNKIRIGSRGLWGVGEVRVPVGGGTLHGLGEGQDFGILGMGETMAVKGGE